jgi:endo-1,4-beta-xylanase
MLQFNWLKHCLLSFTIASLAAVAPVGAKSNFDSVFLWPGDAPGSEGKSAPEKVRLTPEGEIIVSSVNRPSITPYLPDKDMATGVGVIVIPGGGHKELWMDHEGYRVGQWLRDHGVAAFVLKYRLANEDRSTYTILGNSLSDVRRALRLVRNRATDWNVAADRIGVIGFSAGGELAALAGVFFDQGQLRSADSVERETSRPAFVALIYPAIPQDLVVRRDSPPMFLLCGGEDNPAISEGVPNLYLALKHGGIPAELHILSGVGHGFGIRDRNEPHVSQWTTLLYNWLAAQGFLKQQ